MELKIQNSDFAPEMPIEDFDENHFDLNDSLWKLSDTENLDDELSIHFNSDEIEQATLDDELLVSNLDDHAMDGFGKQSTSRYGEGVLDEKPPNEDILLEVILYTTLNAIPLF